MPRILLIDDDAQLGPPLGAYFARFDMSLVCALRPSKGLALLGESAFDVVILDVMLPEMDGFEVCRTLRKTSDVPVIMLTARGDVMDRVVGLELGADDYLPKPFEPRELLARIRAVLRRKGDGGQAPAAAGGQATLRFGSLAIDRDARSVTVAGAEADLTSYQFDLLVAMAERAGRVLTRDQIMEAVRGRELEAFDRSIDVHMGRIRNAIEADPKAPRRILTVRGVGYVFAKQQD
jgi:DNA-binding response OmpR family regulator